MYISYEILNKPIALWINRKHKILHIACEKTNYSRIRINWNYLFDKGKETEQDRETEVLTDQEFRAKIHEELVKGIYEKIQGFQRKGVEKA